MLTVCTAYPAPPLSALRHPIVEQECVSPTVPRAVAPPREVAAKGARQLRPRTIGEQLARLQGHLVTFDGFALDYVELATGPMTRQGHPMESGHHLAEDDPKDLLGALRRVP